MDKASQITTLALQPHINVWLQPLDRTVLVPFPILTKKPIESFFPKILQTLLKNQHGQSFSSHFFFCLENVCDSKQKSGFLRFFQSPACPKFSIKTM
jgi:hypothetical protein